jgi:hypothetical protein
MNPGLRIVHVPDYILKSREVLFSACGQGWQFPREPSKCNITSIAEYQKRLVSGFLYTFGVRKMQQNSHFVACVRTGESSDTVPELLALEAAQGELPSATSTLVETRSKVEGWHFLFSTLFNRLGELHRQGRDGRTRSRANGAAIHGKN